ncbi:hypothetical protein [Paenibacillus sp. MMO-58]|uniref:hypothetical protein n=1 Tax=Paenibacillus sp. MMO-58 TaxID=3081290 RepID=UPI00301B431B
MKATTRAMNFLNRVAIVKLNGEVQPIRIRFEDLKVEEDGSAYFIVSVRNGEERRISTEGAVRSLKLLDTEDQQRLRSLNKWFELVSSPKMIEQRCNMTDTQRAAWASVYDPMKAQRDELVARGVTEFEL